MKLRQKAVQGARWLVFQNMGTRLVSFFVLLVLARLLEPAAFGLVALALTAISFLQIFVASGFASAIIQRDDVEKGHLDTAFWANSLVSIVAVTVLWIGSDNLARFFKEPELESVLLWLSPLIIIRSLNQVQVAILKRYLNFKSLAIRQLVADPIGGAVGVYMAFTGWGVWSLVARELVSAIVRVIILWSSTDWRPGLSVSFRYFRELFNFGVSVLGHNLMGFFFKRSADLLIGTFLGTTALGYFTIGGKICRMITQALGGTLGDLAWPVFSRMQNNVPQLKSSFITASRAIGFLIWPVFVGLAILAPIVVDVVFGEKWLPSVGVMQALVFIGIVRSLWMLNDGVIMAMGKPHWRLFMKIGVTITTIVGMYLIVERGIVAVAIWYVIAAYLFLPLSVWMVKRLIAIDLTAYIGIHLGPMFCSGVMSAAIYGIMDQLNDKAPPVVILITSVFLGALIYMFMVRLISPVAYRAFLKLISELAPVRKMFKSKTL